MSHRKNISSFSCKHCFIDNDRDVIEIILFLNLFSLCYIINYHMYNDFIILHSRCIYTKAQCIQNNISTAKTNHELYNMSEFLILIWRYGNITFIWFFLSQETNKGCLEGCHGKNQSSRTLIQKYYEIEINALISF